MRGINLVRNGIVEGFADFQEIRDLFCLLAALDERPVRLGGNALENDRRACAQADDHAGAAEIVNVLGVDHDPAAGRNNQVLPLAQLLHDFALNLAEIALAVLREDIAYFAAFPPLNFSVHIDQLAFKPLGHQPAGRAFAGSHEPNQNDVCLHGPEPIQEKGALPCSG